MAKKGKAKYTREERQQFRSGAVPDPRGKVAQETPEQANERALADLYGAKGANAGNALINKFLDSSIDPATGQPRAPLGRVGTNLPGSEQSSKRYSDLYDTTQGRKPEQETALANMKAGLGGYTSPEYQAQREQMQRGLNSNMATGAAQLARSQARGKVYGAAASAQSGNLIRGAQNQKDELEQDLMIRNIDEMDRRNLQYGEYGRGLDTEEFDRRAAATKAYGDESAAQRVETLDREKINLGQSNAELAAQIGAYTGAGATNLAQQNTEEAARIQEKGIDALSDSQSSVVKAAQNYNKPATSTAPAPAAAPKGTDTIGPSTTKGPADIKAKAKQRARRR